MSLLAKLSSPVQITLDGSVPATIESVSIDSYQVLSTGVQVQLSPNAAYAKIVKSANNSPMSGAGFISMSEFSDEEKALLSQVEQMIASKTVARIKP